MSWSLRSWEVFQWLCHVHIVEFCPFLIRQVELYNSFVCSHRHVSVSMHMCMSMWSRACLCGHVYAYAVMCMSMRSCACVCGHVMSMWSRACLWGHMHVYAVTCMSREGVRTCPWACQRAEKAPLSATPQRLPIFLFFETRSLPGLEPT